MRLKVARFEDDDAMGHSVPILELSRAEFNAVYDHTYAVDRWASRGLGAVGVMSLAIFAVVAEEVEGVTIEEINTEERSP